MPTSGWYQGASLKLLLQGAALGAFATLGIGFSWGGFMLGSTAKTLADSTANSADLRRPVPTQRRRRRQPDGVEEERLMATGGVCREGRLGDHAGEQGGRFRRIASLRRHS
jgi:hypothetical protein